MRKLPRLSVFTTSRCNLACPLCMARMAPGQPIPPDTTPSELERVIERCRQLAVRYGLISFGGRESTLWPHFQAAVKLLHDSGIADGLFLLTNGLEFREHVEPVLDLIAKIRVSVYPTNTRAVEDLYARYGDRLEYWGEVHRPPPTGPLPETLPAQCICCTVQAYFAGRMWVCPNAYVLSLRGLAADTSELSCSIDEDFAEHWQRYESAKFGLPMCQSCLGNKRVWDRVGPREAPRRPKIDPRVPVNWGRQ